MCTHGATLLVNKNSHFLFGHSVPFNSATTRGLSLSVFQTKSLNG